jgi:hypothetical protein
METIVYYSVQNGGDGSAYPQFMESAELAEWDQEHMDEGWGEACTGSLRIIGDNVEVPAITTALEYYLEKDGYWEEGYSMDEDPENSFIEKFFPNGGIPELKIVNIKKANYTPAYPAGEAEVEGDSYQLSANGIVQKTVYYYYGEFNNGKRIYNGFTPEVIHGIEDELNNKVNEE